MRLTVVKENSLPAQLNKSELQMQLYFSCNDEKYNYLYMLRITLSTANVVVENRENRYEK